MCLDCSMYIYIGLLLFSLSLAPRDSKAQVCSVAVLRVPYATGLGKTMLRFSMWISSVAGVSKII